jgi:DNA-binding beta-propeller fold protein YncE
VITGRLVTACVMVAGAAIGQSLTPGGKVVLPNVNGRIDHFSADLKGQRLFVSALGNHTVEVIDVAAGKRVHTIGELAEPQGVYYDAASGRLFVACAKDGAVKVFDGATFHPVSSAKTSGDADNIRYDARGGRVVVGYGDGALAFFDPSGKKTGEIALDAHPESFQIEKNGTRTFVNVPDRKEIEVVDLTKGTVLAKWPVTSALRNYPMALDEEHHRLFVGCRTPARMLVIDTETGKQTGSVEIVGDTDDLFWDASRGRVYVIGGEGFVDVIDGASLKRVSREATAAGARTGLWVAEWSKLFVAVPHRGAQAAEVRVWEAK